MPTPLSKEFHHRIYLWASCLMVIGLPLSPALLTISIVVLSINWLFEGNFSQKYQLLKHNIAFISIVSIYIFYLLGLAYTSNLEYAMHSLKIKMPILILPIIYGSQNSINTQDLTNILVCYIGSCMAAFIASMYIFLGYTGVNFNFNETYSEINLRELTPVISHIRYSALMVMALFISGYLYVQSNYKKHQYLISSIAFLYLIQLMSVRSSLLSLTLGIVYISAYYIFNPYPLKRKLALLCFLIISPVLLYMFSPSIQAALSEGAWELREYLKTGNGMGYSLSQRLEFWQYSIYIIKQNFFFGVGTGDIIDAFKATYQQLNPELVGWEGMKAHNQYFTLAVTLGVVGLSGYLISLFGLYVKYKLWQAPLYSLFFINFISSQFSDDNLDTQAGVMFFVSFFCLLYLNNRLNESH